MATDLMLRFVFVPAGGAAPRGWLAEDAVVVAAQLQASSEPRSVPLRDRYGVAVMAADGDAA
jgi:hypothetical protein